MLWPRSGTYYFCLHSFVENQPDVRDPGDPISGCPFSAAVLHIGEHKLWGFPAIFAVPHVLPPIDVAWIPAPSLIQLLLVTLMWPFKFHLKFFIISKTLEYLHYELTSCHYIHHIVLWQCSCMVIILQTWASVGLILCFYFKSVNIWHKICTHKYFIK